MFLNPSLEFSSGSFDLGTLSVPRGCSNVVFINNNKDE